MLQVGPTYGRKMMTGYLNSKHNTRIGQNRVGDALKVAAPNYHQRRRTNTARQVNPIPYRADYFGEKVHIDQNEKLVMYGVTHVAAIDGHSRFIVAGATMPVKNNIVIYDKVFRYVFCKCGKINKSWNSSILNMPFFYLFISSFLSDQ